MRAIIFTPAGLVLLAAGGCATRGPNHVYFTQAGRTAVQDLGPASRDIPHAVAPAEAVLGLAYDFNTDHLFVRLARRIRVIERPSGKVLREMPLPAELRTENSADLALRSGDRHLFAVMPDGRAVVELTLFGKFVRRIGLAGLDGPIGGLAYDQKNNRLLVLTSASRARIGYVTPEAIVTYYVTLARSVRPVSLGYDSEAGHFFVPLADGCTLGEFDPGGNLLATHQTAGTSAITAIDAGPRSFVRVF